MGLGAAGGWCRRTSVGAQRGADGRARVAGSGGADGRTRYDRVRHQGGEIGWHQTRKKRYTTLPVIGCEKLEATKVKVGVRMIWNLY